MHGQKQLTAIITARQLSQTYSVWYYGITVKQVAYKVRVCGTRGLNHILATTEHEEQSSKNLTALAC